MGQTRSILTTVSLFYSLMVRGQPVFVKVAACGCKEHLARAEWVGTPPKLSVTDRTHLTTRARNVYSNATRSQQHSLVLQTTANSLCMPICSTIFQCADRFLTVG